MCCWQHTGRGDERSQCQHGNEVLQTTTATGVVNKQDIIVNAGKVNSSVDGVVRQLQPSTLNSHNQSEIRPNEHGQSESRPSTHSQSQSRSTIPNQSETIPSKHNESQSRPSRLDIEDGTRAQNGSVASSAGNVAMATAASSDPASQLPSSQVTVLAGAGKESHNEVAGGMKPQCGGGNSVVMNGNTQSLSSSSDAVIPLPSPPLTPPTAKCRQTDSQQTVLPSPGHGYRSPRQDGRKNSTPDSVELPPPPSPPLQFSQSSMLDSPSGVLPPPPLDDSLYTIPPRVSPPPPMSPVSSAVADIMTYNTTGKPVAPSGSDVSTFIVEQATSLVDGLSALADRLSGFEGEPTSNDQPLVRDTRSDLLAAIREGLTTDICLCVLYHWRH